LTNKFDSYYARSERSMSP